MTDEATYEIELRGRVSDRLLRPVVDEFAIDVTEQATTLLVGPVRDPAHLHGLVMHFTACNVEVVRFGPVESEASADGRTATDSPRGSQRTTEERSDLTADPSCLTPPTDPSHRPGRNPS